MNTRPRSTVALPTLSVLATLTVAALSLPVAAHAVPPLDQLGNYAYTCSGVINGNGLPGIELRVLFDPNNVACKEVFDPQQGAVKANKSFAGSSGGTGTGSGKALTGGRLQVSASNHALAGEAGSAIAGFTDVLTIDAPGLTGINGVLFYKVKLTGSGEAHGASGASSFWLTASVPHYADTHATWGVSTDIFTPDASFAVNETVVMSHVFVFGVPFELSTFAWAHAGVRALGAQGHASVNFNSPNAIRLKGIDHVTTLPGVLVPTYTFASQGNLPWLP